MRRDGEPAALEPAGPVAAVYERPGAPFTVRVQRMAFPTRRERWVASVIENGAAAYSTTWVGAGDAVRWSERIRPRPA